MSNIKLCRSELLGMLGIQLDDNDDPLKTGTHLRWQPDPKIGFPLHDNDSSFRLYKSDISLCNTNNLVELNNNGLPVESGLSSDNLIFENSEGDLIIYFKGKQYQESIDKLNKKINELYRIISLLGFSYDEEIKFLQYLEELSSVLAGHYDMYSNMAEVCAIDIDFLNGNQFTVEAYNFKDECLIKLNRNEIRLRCPGIKYIIIKNVPNHFIDNFEEDPFNLKWVLSEEYSKADIWNHVDGDGEELYLGWLENNNGYGLPFSQVIEGNPNVFIDSITNEAKNYGNTFEFYNNPLPSNTPKENNSEEKEISGGISMGSALTIASSDPFKARVMGLYAYLANNNNSASDFKVEFAPPVFYEFNELIQTYLIDKFGDGPFETLIKEIRTLSEQFFLELQGTHLCGLSLLGDKCSKSHINIDEDPKISEFHVSDLPTRKSDESLDESKTKLFIRSEIDALPSLQIDCDLCEKILPTAVKLERKIGDGAWENTVSNEKDDSDSLGILDKVKLIKIKEGDFLVTDSFFKPTQDIVDLSEDKRKVKYRFTYYDLFGRQMGDKKTTGEKSIDIPCYPPEAPLSPYAEISEDSILKISFSLPSNNYLLSAIEDRMVKYDIKLLKIDSEDGNEDSDGNQLPSVSIDNYGNDNEYKLITLERNNENGTYQLSFDLSEEFSNIFNKEDQGVFYQFIIELCIKGKCPGSNSYKKSPVSRTETGLILPTKTKLVQPKISDIPRATFPDKYGDSYYYIEKEGLVESDNDKNQWLNIYRTSLSEFIDFKDNIFSDGQENGVSKIDIDKIEKGEISQDIIDNIQEQISLLKTAFHKVNSDPIKLNDENFPYPVHVKGEKQQNHILAYIGVDEYPEGNLDEKRQEEQSWEKDNLFFDLFQTTRSLLNPPPVFRLKEFSKENNNLTFTVEIVLSNYQKNNISDLETDTKPGLILKCRGGSVEKENIEVGKQDTKNNNDQDSNNNNILVDINHQVADPDHTYEIELLILTENMDGETQYVKIQNKIERNISI